MVNYASFISPFWEKYFFKIEVISPRRIPNLCRRLVDADLLGKNLKVNYRTPIGGDKESIPRCVGNLFCS